MNIRKELGKAINVLMKQSQSASFRMNLCSASVIHHLGSKTDGTAGLQLKDLHGSFWEDLPLSSDDNTHME